MFSLFNVTNFQNHGIYSIHIPANSEIQKGLLFITNYKLE